MSMPVDHPVLDEIYESMNTDGVIIGWARLSECIEFKDKDGDRYEIVVRPIEETDET